MKNNKGLGLLTLFGATLAMLGPAAAVAVDMSGVVTGVTDQITESWESSIPIIAAVLGITIGVRLIRKWAK